MAVLGYTVGIYPPGMKDEFAPALRRQRGPGARPPPGRRRSALGTGVVPGGDHPVDGGARGRRGRRETRDAAEQILENTFLDGTAGDDFIGVQCYERTVLGPDAGPSSPQPGTRLTQMGYEYWPQVVEYTVRRAAAYTGLPVLVTENGLATEDDAERIEFITTALQGLHRCIADGVDVRGYFVLEPARQLRVAPGLRPQARPVRRGPRHLRRTPQAQRPLVRRRGQGQRPSRLPAGEGRPSARAMTADRDLCS